MNSELSGNKPNLQAVRGGSSITSGVPHGELLSRLVELTLPFQEQDDADLAKVRDDIVAAMSPEALVDAAAVLGNFQRMVRIADGTGIPLDRPVAMISADLREELGFNEFGSANLTPPTSKLGRWVGRRMRPLLVKFVSMGRKPPVSQDS